MKAGWIFFSAKDAFLTRHILSPFHRFSSSSLTGILEKYTVCPFFFHIYAGGGKWCEGKSAEWSRLLGQGRQPVRRRFLHILNQVIYKLNRVLLVAAAGHNA